MSVRMRSMILVKDVLLLAVFKSVSIAGYRHKFSGRNWCEHACWVLLHIQRKGFIAHQKENIFLVIAMHMTIQCCAVLDMFESGTCGVYMSCTSMPVPLGISISTACVSCVAVCHWRCGPEIVFFLSLSPSLLSALLVIIVFTSIPRCCT